MVLGGVMLAAGLLGFSLFVASAFGSVADDLPANYPEK
jgi:hypothetical protein